MKFNLRKAKGHLADTIYFDEVCNVCGKYIDDGEDVLEAENEILNVTICKDCAYDIHHGYEENI